MIELSEKTDDGYKILDSIIVDDNFKSDTELKEINCCGICGALLGSAVDVKSEVDKFLKMLVGF